VGETGCEQPSRQMDQLLPAPSAEHPLSYDI
jgi:serine O-acetyltransferase